MAMNPLSLALSNQDPRLRSRLLYANNLMEEGGSTAPVQTPIEGLARALKGGLGGYFAGQVEHQEDAKKAETQATLARALRAGSGQENTFDPATGQWAAPTGKPDTGLMAKILGSNEQTAPMGLNLQLQDLQYQRERGDKLEDRSANQGFQREMAATQNDYQNARDNLNRAFQAAQQNNSFENQAALQKASQDFQAMQQKSQQMFQLGAAGPIAKAQAEAQAQAKAAFPTVKEQREIADAEKSDTEKLAATDRLRRSIDDLIASPDRERGTGFSAVFNWVPGTSGKDFEAQLDAVKSQAFLPAVAQLKGMGQLSDAEGKKLTAAIGALDSSMSEGEFLRSLKQIKGDLDVARARAGGNAPNLAAPLVPHGQGGGIKFLGFE